MGVGRCLFAVCAISFLNEKCVLNAYLLYESKMSLFGFHSCLISLILNDFQQIIELIKAVRMPVFLLN